MILGQKEVREMLVKDARTMTTRAIAKKYHVTHHASVHNWLQGKNISVQMLEHFTKEVKKAKIKKSEKRKVKGK